MDKSGENDHTSKYFSLKEVDKANMASVSNCSNLGDGVWVFITLTTALHFVYLQLFIKKNLSLGITKERV